MKDPPKKGRICPKMNPQIPVGRVSSVGWGLARRRGLNGAGS